MKKTLLVLFIFPLLVLTSCDVIMGPSIILPDLTGKSRAEITSIMENYDVKYSFEFSKEKIYNDNMLDKFVEYGGSYKAGDNYPISKLLYIYTTVLPLNPHYIYDLTLDAEYEGKSFINDGIGEVVLVGTTDGDTARFKDVVTGEVFRLRFLGVDTPEVYAGEDPWGKAASSYTASRLKGAKKIILEAEGARTENYNRYLGFVWIDGILLNLELVELAYSNSTLSNSKYKDIFLNASIEAMKTGRRFHGEIDPAYDYTNERFY